MKKAKRKASGSKRQSRNKVGSVGAFNKMMRPTVEIGTHYQPVIPIKRQRQRGA